MILEASSKLKGYLRLCGLISQPIASILILSLFIFTQARTQFIIFGAFSQLFKTSLYVACSRATSASGLYLIGNKFEPTKPPNARDGVAKELERHETVKVDLKFEQISDRSNSFLFQLMFHNVQSLRAHIDQVVHDKAYLCSDFLLFAETWTTNSQTIEIPGFKQVARVNVHGSVPKANGSACFVKTSLLESDSVSNVHEQLVSDNAGHKMAISAFVFKDTLIASIYFLPNFKKEVVLTKLEDLLKVDTRFKIIASDFNLHFDDEQNPFSSLFNQYGLSSSLGEEVKSTTKYKSFIDNVFTNVFTYHSGRYISYTSFHDPLFMQFNF
ncbi:hypothetical protein EDC96DRAFT_550353 [Choanephora cucurbitarum]|nr:hypothetical protein EDC96DRAFT_550353 [Choanephora cucurbitarum]